MTDTDALIILNALPKIGPVRVRAALAQFGSPSSILKVSKSQLATVPGIGPETAEVVASWRNYFDLDRERALMDASKVRAITAFDEEFYPPALAQTHGAPLVLYVQGELQKKDRSSIGIVGSRKATHYGIATAKKISYQLALAGITVVSGLAIGIDTAAHEAAIAAENGRTIAVIGSGLCCLYPPQNIGLAEKISDGRGAVVSEFPMTYRADRQSFPQRNRIIAGWGPGVLVIEAPGKSGSLITANQAIEMDRSVYAIPGPIDRPSSHGCNRLIQQGAKLVMDGADILEDLGAQMEWDFARDPSLKGGRMQTMPFPSLSTEERAVFDALHQMETAIDEIIDETGLPPQAVNAVLTRLQLKSLVKQLPGGYYIRTTPE